MEGESCHQLLDLIPKDREWIVQRDHEQRSHRSSEEKKLELRLGPPGEDWTIKDDGTKSNFRERDESLLSLGYFSNFNHHNNNNNNNNNNNTTSGAKRGFIDTLDSKTIENGWIMNNNGSQTSHKYSPSENPVGGTTLSSSPWSSSSSSSDYQGRKIQHQHQNQTKAQFLQFQSSPKSLTVMEKESSQHCCTKVTDLQKAEKKAFSPAPANTAVVPNSPQKRTAPPPVVGWPPIRSFRKNLASSSSSKPAPLSENVVPNKLESEKRVEISQKGLFVKINMDGVPIGRKVDLKAYDSYEKLSSAVDELFRDLLAAQGNSFASGVQNKKEGEKAITGLLDGSGEYTLVYEDNEGDRMLVGDVPWLMFVSTVKRLRVLKSSELSTLCLGTSKQEKLPLDAGSK